MAHRSFAGDLIVVQGREQTASFAKKHKFDSIIAMAQSGHWMLQSTRNLMIVV